MMTSKWLNLSLEDVDNDKSPDVVIEYFDKTDKYYDVEKPAPVFAVIVSSSKKNEVYDSIQGNADANGDGKFSKADDIELYSALANAFVKIAL